MARRRRGGRRSRGRRRRGGNHFTLTVPFIGSLAEAKSQDISYNSIFVGSTKNTFQGVPWRVRKVTYSYANSGFKVSGGEETSDPQPAFFQIMLNTAATDNVEAVFSRRHLSCNITQYGRMFPPNPNPWKEDEDRDQALITVDNIVLGGGVTNTVISYLLHVQMEFGSIPYSHPASLLHQAQSMLPEAESPYSRVSLEDI